MEKCPSNLVSAPLVLLVLLLLEPRPLCRDNCVRLQIEQEESLASVEDDDVVGFNTVWTWTEERPGTIRIDRVASMRRGICPVLDYTVDARGSANGAALPISVEEGDAKLGDRATHGMVYARVETVWATPVLRKA